jgi:hypothetical protein
MEHDNPKTTNPHALAKKFEVLIKEAIARKYGVSMDELKLLLEDKEGVYLSEEAPNTLCCFVVDQRNGYMYLVTGTIDEEGEALTNLKTDVVS